MSLIEAAQQYFTATTSEERSAIIKANPLLLFAWVHYSFTQEYGSDGCWAGIETGTCTLKRWREGNMGGHRSYDFRMQRIEANEESCQAQYNQFVFEAAQEARKRQEAREAYLKAQNDVKANIDTQLRRLFKGARVLVGGKQGTVERSMVSRYDANKVCALVNFGGGKQSWHLSGAIASQKEA